MFKMLFGGSTWVLIILLSACSSLPNPIKATDLSNSKIAYAVESPVQADSIRVKDLRGNTICYKKDVALVPPQTSVDFGFCTIRAGQLYNVETQSATNTYTDKIYGKD